ncbi:MAG: metal ABC transporter ATP-binding protein [Muribaculaceae bacterium]|nr:metal ABC transporter ATP-binding protein [Muribaculaceae bacterium]
MSLHANNSLSYLRNNTAGIHFGGACSHHPTPVEVRLNITDSPLIELRDLGMRRESRVILRDVNLTVNHGDFVAITGPNGGGKTTLLRIILGLLRPTSGSVTFHPARPAIGYLPQKNMIDSQFPLTVREVIASGLLGTPGLKREYVNDRVLTTLQQIELENLADRPIGRLSGGQLQRVLLGRAIISDPQLLVLDEPLSYVDKHFEAHIYRLIAGIAPRCTTLLVSHEMSTIATMANRHLIVDRTVEQCSAHNHRVAECVD